jgi:hypothetical protein
MEKISWTDHVRNEEVLQRVKEEMNILQTIKRRKANWIGHILRRDCLLKHVTEGRIEVKGRRGRILSSYWMALKKGESKEEALGGAVWGTRFGNSYRPVARQST